MQIIVDGYNVIHKLPQLERRLDVSLKSARDALCELLSHWRRVRNFTGSAYVVFDGRGGSCTKEDMRGIECIYTADRGEADKYIVSMIKNSANPGKILVISDDNYVANNCRSHGARVEPASTLLLPAKKHTEPDKAIDNIITKNINNFLRKEWGLD